MSTSSAASPARTPAIVAPIITVQARTVALLATTAFLALFVVYFIGIDQGAVSLFGKGMGVHEFFHDGRHFLGFPCH